MLLPYTSVLYLGFVILLLQSGCLAQNINNCMPYTGPAGLTQCIDIERYDHPQWAVCLTDSYIMEKSRNKHLCEDRSRVYCWYQCQIEEFNGENGPVDDLCKCTVGETINPVIPITDETSIEEWCYSPDGTSCTWYRECLEKRYPCEAEGNGYALAYAERFCELYTTRYNYFTSQGQQWIDATRKCLQVALVHLLRPWEMPTCERIKQEAFDSHSPCYLNPGPGAPSICDLGCADWAQVFWTIKSGFTQVFVESLKGTVEVMLGCGNSFSWFDDNCPSVILQLVVVSTTLRGKRDTDTESDELAGDVTMELARKLRWDSRVMDWYAFTPNVTDSEDNNADMMEINIILGDKIALNLTEDDRSNVIPQFSLEKVVEDMGEALQHGLLYDLNVDGEKISVSSLNVCQDSQCEEEEPFLNVTAGPRPTAPSSTTNTNGYPSVFLVMIIAIWTQVVLYWLN